MDVVTLVLAVTAISGLYMAWNIGANDVANAVGTSVGSGALSLRNALVVAAVFELGGALLAGGEVADTIADGIVPLVGIEPLVVAAGMASSLIAAALWIHTATFLGWPVSTTHSIVGAVMGFGLVAAPSSVNWPVLGQIGLTWVISPALGGLGAYLIFSILKRRVIHADNPQRAIALGGPLLVALLVALTTTWILSQARPPLGMDMSPLAALPWALSAGLLGALATSSVLRTRPRGGDHEPLFAVLQVVTACFIAFAHGSNDVANAVGPIGAAFAALESGIDGPLHVPPNVLMIGACGIVLGLATYGHRVMATIGREITQLTPSRGFAAELSAATTIVCASSVGLPVSTTNVLVGAVVGVGLTRSLGAVNLRVVRGIATSWVLTVPACAAVSAALTALASVWLPG